VIWEYTKYINPADLRADERRKVAEDICTQIEQLGKDRPMISWASIRDAIRAKYLDGR
jgi:hypothetical protein